MSKTRDLIDRLPELPLEPFEAAGRLERSDRGPFLTIRPHKYPAPKHPTVRPRAQSKSSYAIRKYFTQALYPRVICYDPGDLIVGLKMNFDPQPLPERDRPPTDITALAVLANMKCAHMTSQPLW
jgi:hypothetical protein